MVVCTCVYLLFILCCSLMVPPVTSQPPPWCACLWPLLQHLAPPPAHQLPAHTPYTSLIVSLHLLLPWPIFSPKMVVTMS